MRRVTTLAGLARVLVAGAWLLHCGAAWAQVDTVATNGAFTLNYVATAAASPRVPWSDVGLQATAAVDPGQLSGATGGATAYQLTSSLGGGQTFTPGTTQIDLAYTPGWTGSLSTAATGSFGVNLGYSFGPISGSVPVLNDTMAAGASGLDLSGALNSNSSASTVANASGASVTAGLTAKAQAGCPFCVTIASASLDFTVGSHLADSVSAGAQVTYGDLIWYSNGANTVAVANVTGSGGTISNTFSGLSFSQIAALGLPSSGGSFQLNILPYAALSLNIDSAATVSLPASLTYSYDVLGIASGGGTIASGNLYSLSTGDEAATATGLWYAPDVYSVQMDASCLAAPAALLCDYQTFNVPDPVTFGPGGSNPNIPISFGPLGPPSGGGGSTDFPNFGPLIPGDVPCVPGAPCEAPCVPNPDGPNSPDLCVNQVTVSQTGVPEPGTLGLLVAALLGAPVAVRRRRRC